MAEVVHMQLFLGMLIYFVVISRAVSGSVTKIKAWDRLATTSLNRIASVEPVRDMAYWEREGIEYARWQKYFISRMVRWHQRHPANFRGIMAQMGIDSLGDGADQCFEDMLQDFPFHRYLSLNVAAGISDSIHIHGKTWFVMIILFGIFALLHRFAHFTLHQLMPGFVVVAVVILMTMQVLVMRKQWKFQRRFQTDEFTQAEGNAVATETADTDVLGNSREVKSGLSVRRFHERFSTELFVLRALQIVIFLLAYILARDLLDVQEWQTMPGTNFAFACVFTFILSVLGYFLLTAVPSFLALMAMPPYVDLDNFEVFAGVLAQSREERQLEIVRSLTAGSA